MKPCHALLCAGAMLASLVLVSGSEAGPASEAASPVYRVAVPEGYRQWELIAPAIEAQPPNELRVVLGNRTAMNAYRAGTLPLPGGTVLVKLAWKQMQSLGFDCPPPWSRRWP